MLWWHSSCSRGSSVLPLAFSILGQSAVPAAGVLSTDWREQCRGRQAAKVTREQQRWLLLLRWGCCQLRVLGIARLWCVWRAFVVAANSLWLWRVATAAAVFHFQQSRGFCNRCSRITSSILSLFL